MGWRDSVVIALVVFGCRNSDPNHHVHPTDAMPDGAFGGGGSHDISECYVGAVVASCVDSHATITLKFTGGFTSLTLCHKPPVEDVATCANGCALSMSLDYFGPADVLVTKASMLCAETPAATVGQACTPPGPQTPDPRIPISCLPTRAQLNTDGTVASQTYLACDAGSQTCETKAAPTVAAYLQPCDAQLLAQYGVENANGAVEYEDHSIIYACLLAWDLTTSSITSGTTIECAGDWQCPTGSLCDDQIPWLVPPPSPRAVCKPGPRGTLTPGMLTP